MSFVFWNWENEILYSITCGLSIGPSLKKVQSPCGLSIVGSTVNDVFDYLSSPILPNFLPEFSMSEFEVHSIIIHIEKKCHSGSVQGKLLIT